jgi:hypothetical protein
MKGTSRLAAILWGSVAIAMAGPVGASTIDNTQLTWNTSNVALNQPLTEGFASIVYQGTDFTTAETNGRIYYDGDEAGPPGLVAINDGYSSGQGEFDGCIRASAADICATGFRTGNRFKMQLTDTGSIDLVFNVGTDPNANALLPNGDPQPNPDGSLYQVFGRAVNLTTQMLDKFTIELGYNIGGAFTPSEAGDGLSFAQNLSLAPNGATAFTQYPFGLFGDETTTQNHDIDGFFDDDRAGFNLVIGEDMLASAGFYGGDLGYEARFGSWLSQEMAPAGLLWDDDGDAATDALVMAWFNEDIGMWEALRSIGLDGDGNLEAISILDTPQQFATEAAASSFFEDIARGLLGDDDLVLALEAEEHIEDLANLNLNFGILLTDAFAGDSFTLRFTSVAAPAPVPLPASVLFLVAGMGALGALRRAKGGSARG